MTKLQLHSTARPARCKGCGDEFSALWGENVIHALSGSGLCDGCKKKAERASKVKIIKPKPPGLRAVEDSDDGTETGPVQAKSD